MPWREVRSAMPVIAFVYGAVADYINVSCCTIDNPYLFNVADVLIFGGAIFLVLSREVFQHDRPETDVSELRDNV
jgi:lipoprotein signal peptidase